MNKSRKLKILFTINDRTLPVITDGLTFWSIQDGFDPESSVPYLSKPIVVNKGEMLKRQIMFINGKTITVLDLIKFLSHVQGAVHAGKPKDEKEEILRHVEETLTIGGMPGGVRSIGAIGRVVLRGLKPLKQEILKT